MTTPEEYAIWETLGRYYRVDYSYVKYQRQATDVAKQEVYGRLKNLCERLESGKRDVLPGETFSITFPDERLLTPFCSRVVSCDKKKFILYTDVNGYDAHLMLSLVYEYDKTSNEVVILQKEVRPMSFSCVTVSVDKLSEKFELSYIPEFRQFKGYCYAMMKVVDPEGETHIEQVNVNFFIDL